MNVLVLGGGGRESAIVKNLSESGQISKLYPLPGNAGMEDYASLIAGSVTDIDAVKQACREYQIDFCCVTPDDPLALGMVDALEAIGVACFGPDKKAARIEASKAFAKELMRKYSIPTASYKTFTNINEALSYVKTQPYPLVVKADGLALGKGVIIANTEEEAGEALHEMMENHAFGKSGETVVIEEFLTGPEVSVLAFTDGETLVPMVSSMDHKRAHDNDEGPNTGGMGTIAPNPFYTKEIADECMERIFLPTIKAMKAEGCPFKGCLYFGLMITKDGPKVIEYNSRFGDPETQVVLPLLESDLFKIMRETRDGTLKAGDVVFSSKAACCVVMASGGYPGKYAKGKVITMEDGIESEVYMAGVSKKDGRLVTNGGRVLGVTATADTMPEAIKKAYADVKKINFENAEYRSDIGKRALEAI